ncbi:MAG TPA: NfeD family protein [Gemmataceae bacterium]|nr:NfeD family protein [Gemmataceae bacterium]
MDDYLSIALILIAVGVVFLAAEILLPTGGILVVGALLFFALGVGTILYNGTTAEAAVAMAGLAIGLPASGYVAVHAWRRMSLGRTSMEGDAGDESLTAAVPQLGELEQLRGRVGKTVSPMRPSGTVEFDNTRVDAMTEGVMIDAGVFVRCVDVRGGKVIVRQMDAPKDITDINLDEPKPAPRRDPLDDIDLDLK